MGRKRPMRNAVFRRAAPIRPDIRIAALIPEHEFEGTGRVSRAICHLTVWEEVSALWATKKPPLNGGAYGRSLLRGAAPLPMTSFAVPRNVAPDTPSRKIHQKGVSTAMNSLYREQLLYDPKFHQQRNTIIMDGWRIEKMARALCAQNKEDPDGTYAVIEDGVPVQRPRWWRYMDRARVALEAHEGNYRPSLGSV